MKKILFPLMLIAGVMLVLSCKKKDKDKDNDPNDPTGSASKIELAVSPWPCFGQNPQLSFTSPNYGPAATPTVKWSVNISKGIPQHSMVIGADGILYVNSRRILYAVKPEDGSVKWSYDAKMDLSESPIIDKNNIVYITGLEYGMSFDTYGDVIAIKADSGTMKWKFNSKDSVSGGYKSAPNIGYEGYLYVAETNSKKIYALNAKGEKVWEFTTPYPIVGPPAVGIDSVLYFCTHQSSDGNGSMITLLPGGTQKWRVDFTSSITPQPVAIDNTGLLYITYKSTNSTMYCYKNTNKLQWSLFMQSGNSATKLAVSNAGAIYYHDDGISASSFLNCIKDQALVFSNPYLYGNTTIDNDGNILCVGSNSLKAHNITTKTDIWSYSLGTYTTDPAAGFVVIDKAGVIYITTSQGYLIALK